MKVLVFTSLFPNNMLKRHGVFIKERVTHFAKRDGCEVKVVAPVPFFPPLRINYRWKYSQVLEFEPLNGLEIYHPRYFMIPKIAMALQGWMMFLGVLRKVREIQDSFDFDLIDAHYMYPDGFAAVLLGKTLRRPVVVSARGSDINLFSEIRVIRGLLRYTLARAVRVISVSKALKEAMVRLGTPQDKIKVIPNGVDKSKFYPIPREEARTKLGLRNRTILLSVGHLVPVKGFDLILKALQILVETHHRKDLYLVIAGDGVLRKKLEQLIATLHLKDNVLLVGEVPHQELVYWYNAADFFCLGSSHEGWPNVILEAMSCGKPVIGTKVGGIPEIIENVQLGLLTQRSEEEIAQTILDACTRQWHPEKILEFADKHSWEQVAGEVQEVFEEALQMKG
jgi:glycosyltransferase involved in cell wall biosynthesis